MNKILKIVIVISITLFIFGCNISAKQIVERYLDRYITLDENVLEDINNQVKKENLNEENSLIYKEILKKQYEDLEYEITNEEYNGDDAIITVKISVYDLYSSIKDSHIYLNNNPSEFGYNTENYDLDKFIKYKLNNMKNQTKKIDYTIDFYVVNTSDGWSVGDLSNEDIEKIHGIYNYES